jgi:hypothetical protein
MIYEVEGFDFEPPREVAFARRILIKPFAAFARPHPLTTSRETLFAVITGIRKISNADILILERSSGQETMNSIYQELDYHFPHTTLMDVDQCAPVAIENPLPRPFAQSTFWIPSVILSCDFLITISPFRVIDGCGDFSIRNLLGLLPISKYKSEIAQMDLESARNDIDNIIADLYFTLPFDLGIIDGRKRLTRDHVSGLNVIEDYQRIIVGTPYEVDREATRISGIISGYLELIDEAKAEQRGYTNGF